MASNRELAEMLERKLNGARCVHVGELLLKEVIEALRNSVRKEENK
jgi:hypothetical protein